MSGTNKKTAKREKMKFLAVLKREYKKVVFKWAFLITTFLMPLIAAMFVVVPIFIFSIEGETTRIAVADLSGKISERFKNNLSPEKIRERARKAARDSLTDINPSQEKKLERSADQLGGNFKFVDYAARGKTVEEVKKDLNRRVAEKQLDAYIVIPENFSSADAKFEFFSRKAGDFVINSTLRNSLNEAVRTQRLADSNISEDRLEELSRNINFDVKSITETGEEKEESGSFWAAFVVAMLIYIVLQIYGQSIMSAIVEEKETRVAEILFSSAKPFELMLGKLIGVGLAGLTQLAIWIVSLLALLSFGFVSAAMSDADLTLPVLSPQIVIYFFVFFLLGYFIYATIYALIGSMVTNMQEGGQFAFPPIMLLLIGLYFCFAVVRDPNSAFAFWVSIAPFFAPIVMPVRILAEVPPFWQIALAVVLNLATIIILVWTASRVYRIGMLMYGKRATIPEVWKWIRQD